MMSKMGLVSNHIYPYQEHEHTLKRCIDFIVVVMVRVQVKDHSDMVSNDYSYDTNMVKAYNDLQVASL